MSQTSEMLTDEQRAIIEETLDTDMQVCGVVARAGSG